MEALKRSTRKRKKLTATTLKSEQYPEVGWLSRVVLER